jgi:uncharacterized membrane protein (TIGR01666 family)
MKRITTIKAKSKEIWINVFWKSPHHLLALKVTVSIVSLVVPSLVLFEGSYMGTTMAMGVVGMALGETDVHPRGKMKAAGIALVLFLITSSLVELLFPYPLYFTLLATVAAFTLTLAGGFNARMQGVTFGTLLIFVYTMLGAGNGEEWYYVPVLHTIGASAYAIVSILLLKNRPYRLIKEQLAQGFHYLAEYIHLKARLFPSDPQEQVPIRNQLAQKNIALAQQVESCKNELYSYSEESSTNAPSLVDTYYRKWFLLQEMQERAMSSHEKYDLLSEEVGNTALLEGLGQLMREIGQAMHRYADTLLTDQPYKHPLSLRWTLSAVQKMLEEEKGQLHYGTLSLLTRNLAGLEANLRENALSGVAIDVATFTTHKREKPRLKDLLARDHPRFRFAVRLSLAWLLGYGMMQVFELEKGAWVLMTSLIVFQQTYSATRMRLFHRIFGTLMGVVLGVTLAHLLPTLPGQILMLFSSIYLFFYWLKKNYTVAAVFITTYALASFNILSDQGIAVMFPRIIDTLAGAIIAYLVTRFLWPDWQFKQLPGLLLLAVSKNKRYFDSTYHQGIADEIYFQNRGEAYYADNALASSWKGMRLEPKQMRQFEDRAFNLSNLNHALLSYISAFGVHRYAELSEKEHAFCREVSNVLGYVAALLTTKADQTQLQSHLQMASRWEENMEPLQTYAESHRAGLIYNIAHASRELLLEAAEMVKLDIPKGRSSNAMAENKN